MKFKPGDKVQTTKGDRFRKAQAQSEVLIVQGEAAPFRGLARVKCLKPCGRVSSYIERNLIRHDQ